MAAQRFPHDQRQSPSTPQGEEKLPPQNCDAEMALFSSILIDASIMSPVVQIAQPGDCYRVAHRSIIGSVTRRSRPLPLRQAGRSDGVPQQAIRFRRARVAGQALSQSTAI
jgi:hypothetical protein